MTEGRKEFETPEEEFRKSAGLMLDHPCFTNFMVELRAAFRLGQQEENKRWAAIHDALHARLPWGDCELCETIGAWPSPPSKGDTK